MAGHAHLSPEFPEQFLERLVYTVVADLGRPGEDADDLLAGLGEQADRLHRSGVLLEDVVGIPDSLFHALGIEDAPESCGCCGSPKVVQQLPERREDHPREVEDFRSEDRGLPPAGGFLHLVCEPVQERTLPGARRAGDHHRLPVFSRPRENGGNLLEFFLSAAELPGGRGGVRDPAGLLLYLVHDPAGGVPVDSINTIPSK